MVVCLIKKLRLLRNNTNKSYITFGRALHLEAEFKKRWGGGVLQLWTWYREGGVLPTLSSSNLKEIHLFGVKSSFFFKVYGPGRMGYRNFKIIDRILAKFRFFGVDNLLKGGLPH